MCYMVLRHHFYDLMLGSYQYLTARHIAAIAGRTYFDTQVDRCGARHCVLNAILGWAGAGQSL